MAAAAVASVAISWCTLHTAYALRYATLYYELIPPPEIAAPLAGDEPIGFHQATPPAYLDFAYIAFTIGMTFQLSDNDVQHSAIRAAALRHALLSYLFGAVIIATTINFVTGLRTAAS